MRQRFCVNSKIPQSPLTDFTKNNILTFLKTLCLNFKQIKFKNCSALLISELQDCIPADIAVNMTDILC